MLESMEVKFILIEMSSCFFKIHHFYVESVFSILNQIPNAPSKVFKNISETNRPKMLKFAA